MTRDDILSMSAGKELDELVAEKVMGWKRTGQCWKDDRGNTRTIELTSFGSFEPSQDISAAWTVTDEIVKQGYSCVEIEKHGSVVFCTVWDGDEYLIGQAETAPEAICKAALLAVMKE